MGNNDNNNISTKNQTSSKYWRCLVFSILLNFAFFGYNLYFSVVDDGGLSWSRGAAGEAEAVASISCSGHGRAYLDGVISAGDGLPVCECNTCYGGSDCSQFSPSCSADADGGNPLFLEPYWRQRAAASALVVSGWHRMGYSFPDGTNISPELERHIRQLHAVVGNAVTEGRFIVFGAGSTQLLNAAVHALSPDVPSTSSRVVATAPFYPIYELQTEYFASVDFQYQGDTSLWIAGGNSSKTIIEFVTSPNNPDGKLNEAVLKGPNFKAIYDRAYYWPHFTPIPAADDGELKIFTLSKLTGHAGSRFGWAIVKDEDVYNKMLMHMQLNTMGVSRDTQLRALKLLKTIMAEGGGRTIFDFGYQTMKSRWEKLRKVVSVSKRFSLQDVSSHYCVFSGRVRESSPAYGWLKCEREEESDCYGVLKAAGIIGRGGSVFYATDRNVRLSLIKTRDDFDLLVDKLQKLVSAEQDEEEGGGDGNGIEQHVANVTEYQPLRRRM
ncbi:unnamed protein product [Linum tenue]|uniref:Uncharacterized protein n=1 Tax=Linum tenue TaxID=586396 RepID=A0AAV0IFQ3_9ROSI|nr:unnamed protein product [Linum tenue]